MAQKVMDIGDSPLKAPKQLLLSSELTLDTHAGSHHVSQGPICHLRQQPGDSHPHS